MQLVPTPAWIERRQLTGPTSLVIRWPVREAIAFAAIFPGALALLTFITGRADMSVGILLIGVIIVAVVAVCAARFRVLTGPDWLAAEYVTGNRLIRLDSLVKASCSVGSWTWLRLDDSHGGNVKIQVAVTWPRIRRLVVPWLQRACMSGHLKIDARTASILGLEIRTISPMH